MPELPEVETTRRGLAPHLTGVKVREVIIRRHDLRMPVPECLVDIAGRKITAVRRRAKYLLLDVSDGSTVLIHLGMSGSLRMVPPDEAWKKHDHVGITMGNGLQARFHDPRRFGLVLHLSMADPQEHPLLRDLGPEPLDDDFTPAVLAAACAGSARAIKLVIMDNHVVVGVGNIYAAEALFRAGINPLVAAGSLGRQRIRRLVTAIRSVLTEAITSGGTTLRDFLNSDGKPGYFAQHLDVYGRQGEPCHHCGRAIRHAVLGQRATFWCPRCQR